MRRALLPFKTFCFGVTLSKPTSDASDLFLAVNARVARADEQPGMQSDLDQRGKGRFIR